jgi:hypothetical protein
MSLERNKVDAHGKEHYKLCARPATRALYMVVRSARVAHTLNPLHCPHAIFHAYLRIGYQAAEERLRHRQLS